MRFNDVHPSLLEPQAVHKAEIMSFTELRDADNLANALKEIAAHESGYEVFMFAAGRYYVVLIHPEFIEDKDVKNTNS